MSPSLAFLVVPKRREQPTQKTQPRGKDKATGKAADPIDIPVPKRTDVMKVLERVARSKKA